MPQITVFLIRLDFTSGKKPEDFELCIVSRSPRECTYNKYVNDSYICAIWSEYSHYRFFSIIVGVGSKELIRLRDSKTEVGFLLSHKR